MKNKGDGLLHYAHCQSIIKSLAGIYHNPFPRAGCVNRCHLLNMLLCASFDGSDYKPVKIRKTTMKKIIKRRKHHEE